MKKHITILLFIFIISCSKDKHKDYEVMNDFMNNIFLVENYKIEYLNKYMTDEYVEKYNSLSKKENEIHEKFTKAIIDKVKKTLSDNDNKYEIIEEEKLTKEKYKGYYDIDYQGNGKIYRLIINENYILFFILENQKIYSFCPDIYQSSKGKVIPYFFFEK
ncbi:hypothetical protein [uncultured Kordia sp.]|uniref:hypothetical protein n=1 Tax=uncultured Kordia sp. TaxID=507699 RepID=UPI00261B6F42|nr:hypothetical protein [uncultured Kordia sp.]